MIIGLSNVGVICDEGTFGREMGQNLIGWTQGRLESENYYLSRNNSTCVC